MNMDSYKCCTTNPTEISKIEKINNLLKLIGDKSRLQILCMLRQNEHCVCELMEHILLSQSLISHHLRDLKDVGLVASEKRGLRVYYRLTKKGEDLSNHIFNLI